jgi:hypothetical protein
MEKLWKLLEIPILEIFEISHCNVIGHFWDSSLAILEI